MTEVHNLANDKVLTYSLQPKEAVIAAFAQEERKDYNTWDYGKKYGYQVITGRVSYRLGNWTALKDA